MRLPVLVLAGTRRGEKDPVAQLGGVSHKALVPVGGTPMIRRVLQALSGVPGLGPVTISIDDPSCLNGLLDAETCRVSAQSPSESVSEALEAIGTPCLLTTADSALLRPEWISEFISQAKGCDLAVAIALEETVRRDVPGTKRTYIRLSDLQFSGCNLFWLGSEKARNVVDLWKTLQRNRKHPLKMARTLGFGTLLRALTKRLDSQALCRRITRLTGAEIRLVPLSDGRAAVDVDKAADLALVEKLLGTSSS